MKQICLSVLALLTLSMATTGWSKVKIEEEVLVLDSHKLFLPHLSHASDLVIDHVSSQGYEVYGPKGLKAWLKVNGIDYVEAVKASAKAFASYPNYTQVVAKLTELSNKRPDLVKLFSIGKTSKGRDLWMVKISDNVEKDELEPEVKYISSMHGDEITGRELMLRLIEDLINGYGTDDSITKLINNTEVYIMASMNPDGSELHQRGNGRGADINRDFPDFSTNDNQNTFENREIETVNMMKFQASRNFALSANFHGGSVVVNYPWDTSADLFPLDNLVRELSLEYASTVPGMYDSREFSGGVTNGYQWYEVDGGMQDWSYFWHGDLQLTIELSGIKWPDYSQIDSFYKNNKGSLILFLTRVHQGAGFNFNAPKVGSVNITNLNNNDLVGTFKFSKAEFYKVLEVGHYKFEVTTDDGLNKSFDVKVSKDMTSAKYTSL